MLIFFAAEIPLASNSSPLSGQEHSKADDRIESLLERNHALAIAHQESKTKLREQELALAMRDFDNQALSMSYQEESQKNALLEPENRELKERVEKLEEQNARLKDAIEKSNAEHVRITAENSNLKRALEDKNKELQESHEKITYLSEKFEALNRARHSFTTVPEAGRHNY